MSSTKSEHHHQCNTYKSTEQAKVNFEDLAKKYPEFNDAWNKVKEKQVASNKKRSHHESFSTHVDMDFNTSLCRSIMKERYGLSLPNLLSTNDRLCPAVPNRVNFVRWIRDILSFFQNNDNLHYRGIDIGVGASCIYPLLLTTCEFSLDKKWLFFGTEIDELSLKLALENVKANQLENRIHLQHLKTKDNPLLSALNAIDKQKEFDFCMTNPPFFNEDEDAPIRRDNRDRTIMTSNESITKGGEYEFISQLIQDSLQTRRRINWYTSLVGHKKTLDKLEKYLNYLGFGWSNVFIATFVQGDSHRRWGIAWTYFEVPVRYIGSKLEKITSFKVPIDDKLADTNALVEVSNRINAFCKEQCNVKCHQSKDIQDGNSMSLSIVECNTGNDNKEETKLKLLPKEGNFLVDVIIKETDGPNTAIVTLQSYVHSSIGSKIVAKFLNAVEGEICRCNRRWRRLLNQKMK